MVPLKVKTLPSILLEKVLYPNQINKPVRDTHVQHRTP